MIYDYTYGQIIIILALIVLLFLASFWEFKDYERIKSRPYLCDISCPKKKKKELEFHGCFNLKNNIQWRGIYIMAFVATFLVMYIISQFYSDRNIDLNMAIIVFGAILIVFYIGNIFRTYHLYRDMCARVKSDKTGL